MGSFLQRKSVRILRKVFRWFRIAALFSVFLLLAAFAYLHLIGLPDFLKRPLLRTLRERGFEAQFTSARLGWGPSIIIEHAAFNPTNQAAGPLLRAAWTELALNPRALLRARLQVDSFAVRDGALQLPVSPTNQAPLALTNVNLKVTLPSTNRARLKDSDAWFRGIHLRVNGEVLDFLSMSDWKVPLPPPLPPAPAGAKPNPPPTTNFPSAWEIVQQIQFDGIPEMNLHFSADGDDINSLRTDLEFTAPGAQSPWGQSGPLILRVAGARLRDSGADPFLQARLMATSVASRWASARKLSLEADLSRDSGSNIAAVVHLDATTVASPWAKARKLAVEAALSRKSETNFAAVVHVDANEAGAAWDSPSGGQWVQVTNLLWDGTATLPAPGFIPREVEGTLRAARISSGWGTADTLSALLRASRLPSPPALDPAWGRWAVIRSWALDAQASATNIVTPKIKLQQAAAEAQWRGPQFTARKIEAAMDSGHLNAAGDLDALSREVHLHLALDFDPHKVAPLLTAPAQKWISQFDWVSPPRFDAALRFVLPPWTNRMDDWPEGLRRGVQLAGDFSIGPSSFRGVAASSAAARFSYTNRVWSVSNLRVAGPAGALDLDYTSDEATHAYYFRFDSRVDPAAILPLLPEKQQSALRQVSFKNKPDIRGEVRGDWRVPHSAGFAGTVAASNFIVRGEPVDQVGASLEFTNARLRVTGLALALGAGRVSVPLATIDFASNVIFLTNAVSTIDPEPVRRALGKLAPPFMKEIHFDSLPRVEAAGFFTPGKDLGTDLHFVAGGDHFHWRGFSADSITGAVDYKIRTVLISNVQAGVYGAGKLNGWVAFEWEPRRSTSFRTDFSCANVPLGALVRDVTSKSNKIEGILDGQFAAGGVLDTNLTHVAGHGSIHVHNALLWDIKLFGVFTPILNAIAPGAGQSRAREASAEFVLTNGALYSDNLEIHSSAFRLTYRGSIDLKRRLNARVEAHLLRDTPFLGHVLSWMLTPLDKLFEYRVTGTLDKPVPPPLYIPKQFMMLLRPFHSIKSLLPPSAPAPSDKPPPPPAK